MNTAAEIFRYFSGSWSIARRFGPYGTATGTAQFIHSDLHLMMYREDLKMQLLDFEDTAYQAYVYEMEGDHLYKKFRDYRLFYRLYFAENCATGNHTCGQDTYHAHYSFLGENNFTLKYKIKGPHKNYSIFTEFSRTLSK